MAYKPHRASKSALPSGAHFRAGRATDNNIRCCRRAVAFAWRHTVRSVTAIPALGSSRTKRARNGEPALNEGGLSYIISGGERVTDAPTPRRSCGR